MIEVHKNIFVGSETDCFHDKRDDWIVIHACKNPCHCHAVGYSGSLPNNHPEYLISEKENNLYLNMVDMTKPLSPVYTHPIMKKALSLIYSSIKNKKILIHCNFGQSRSASIILVYLARENKISKDSFNEAFKGFLELYPNYNPGEGIKAYLNFNWGELMDENFIT